MDAIHEGRVIAHLGRQRAVEESVALDRSPELVLQVVQIALQRCRRDLQLVKKTPESSGARSCG